MQIKTVFIRLISVIRIYWKSGAGGVILTNDRLHLGVELEGFEPSSKRGTSALSTCLFRPSLSGGTKTRTTKSLRIL